MDIPLFHDEGKYGFSFLFNQVKSGDGGLNHRSDDVMGRVLVTFQPTAVHTLFDFVCLFLAEAKQS